MSVCVYVGHGYKNLTGPTLTLLSVSGLFSSHHLSCCASSMKRKGHSIPQWSQILAFRWRTRTDGRGRCAWFTHNSFLAFAARRIIVQQCPAHSHPHTFYWERQWVESEKRACLRSVLAELGCGCRWLSLRLLSLTWVERKLIAKHFFTNVSFAFFPCLAWSGCICIPWAVMTVIKGDEACPGHFEDTTSRVDRAWDALYSFCALLLGFIQE